MRKILIALLVLFSTQVFAQRKVQWRDLGATVKDRINSKGVFLSTWGNLSAAVDAATAGYLIIDDSVLTTVNKDLSAITVMFTEAGMLNVQSGDTITFSAGNIIADTDQKIFHDGGGEVRMPGAHIYVKWFGVTADGSTEDSGTLQWASDALRLEGDAVIPHGRVGKLELPKGTLELNPASRMVFLPDSGKAIEVFGQPLYATKIHNTDVNTAGDLLTDTPVIVSYRHGGTIYWHDIYVTGTKQLDSGLDNEVNVFGVVVSKAIFERIRVDSAGARAFAFEGLDDGTGFQDIYMRDIFIKDAFGNGISINKHSTSHFNSIVLKDIVIDGYSEIVPDSTTSTGYPAIQILGRTGANNTGHSILLDNITIKNGQWGALTFNGPEEVNSINIKGLTIKDIDITYFTGGAAVLVSSAWGGFVDGLKISSVTGGSAWRDRTGNGNWSITNAIIDSSDSYAFDLFGTNGYMISNSRILDNTKGFFANNGSGYPWFWLTNSHIRGDTLGYYTYEFNLSDVASLTGTKVEITEPAYTTAGENIVYNGYFASDSGHTPIDLDSDGLPDGWNISFPYNEIYRDSVTTYLSPDSGLVIENYASQQLDFLLWQDVSDRLSGSDTYEVNLMTLDDKANTLRILVNSSYDSTPILTSTYQLTSQTITTNVGVGRTGGTKMAANSRLVIKWIECLVE